MTAAQIIEACSVGIVGIGVLLVVTRSIARSIWLLAVQSALVGLAALGVGMTQGIDHLVVGGLLALLAKGVVVPVVLFAVRLPPASDVSADSSTRPSWAPIEIRVTVNGWFAARPSGTENIYKIYAESFKNEGQQGALVSEAQEMVNHALGSDR